MNTKDVLFHACPIWWFSSNTHRENIQLHTHIHTYRHIHTHRHTYTHRHTHTDTHTQTHTQTLIDTYRKELKKKHMDTHPVCMAMISRVRQTREMHSAMARPLDCRVDFYHAQTHSQRLTHRHTYDAYMYTERNTEITSEIHTVRNTWALI